MLRRISLVSLFIFAIVRLPLTTQAMTVPNLTLSTTLIRPFPGQYIDVIASGGDAITGISLAMEIGNGDGIVNEPVFTGIDFSTGPIDDVGHVEGNDGPVVSREYLIEAFVVTLSPADEFAVNGVIATIEIDAAGFSSGEQFPLSWSWSTGIAGDAKSSFVIDDQELIVTPAAVMLTIIPEPTSCSLFAFAFAHLYGCFARRWRVVKLAS